MHENRETSSAPVEQTGRSEKALCRTANMYALEESDRCVGPMKQLNKEGNLRRRLWREGGDPRRPLHYLARARLRAGNLCRRGRAECADSSTQLSKGRAVCANSARTDLCGGRFVRIVPTATPKSFVRISLLRNLRRQGEAVASFSPWRRPVRVVRRSPVNSHPMLTWSRSKS